MLLGSERLQALLCSQALQLLLQRCLRDAVELLLLWGGRPHGGQLEARQCLAPALLLDLGEQCAILLEHRLCLESSIL